MKNVNKNFITSNNSADALNNSLDEMNDAQKQAVTMPSIPVLVLAGAGSGKTRVLTNRVAWLVHAEHLSPMNILAVTFTNKAANEMRQRIESIAGTPSKGMWIGTFHSLSHRLLRLHWRDAKLMQNFQIIDSDDQFRLIKRTIKNLGLDDTHWPPRQAQHFINAKKDEGLRPQHIDANNDPITQQLVRIYTAYHNQCEQSHLVDFAELLLRALETLRDNPALLQHYRDRFKHVLIDEFQDTNTLQYAWLRLLAGDKSPIFAVGDDDQSIYGWRGAKIENIQQFSKDYPLTEVVRLEQNYRSTSTILNAANALISNNQGRMGKNLWTEGNEGELIEVYTSYNEYDEARYIGEYIKQETDRGRPHKEIAILYRSNAQSRVLEETFIGMQIPYRVYGGLRFFERAEIKDALAYLRLSANQNDNASFERIINHPPRGLGERTVQKIRDHAIDTEQSLFLSLRDMVQSKELTSRAKTAGQRFIDLIDSFVPSLSLPLHETIEHINTNSALIAHFEKDTTEKGLARVDNLKELVSAARGFNYEQENEEELPLLDAFLAHASLEAGEGQASIWDDCVQMMSLHSAKGLEFPVVFLAGMEEGLFPHQMALEEGGRLEEERRLCYVGITRAMEKLVISHAERRRIHGNERYQPMSRFIGELPKDTLRIIRPTINTVAPSPSQIDKELSEKYPYKLGSTVVHPKFGTGVVLNYEGSGEYSRVQVNFIDHGTKWLVLNYAKLSSS